MAYRRRQGITRASTFKEEIHHQQDGHLSGSPALNSSYSFSPSSSSSSSPQSSSLAAQAIRASASRRESSFDSESLRSKVFSKTW